METIDRISGGFFSSAGFKLALIIFLTLILLIPAFMIRDLIREREQRRDETIQEVTSVWGNAQTLSGPVLTVQIKSIEKTGPKEYETIVRDAHFLPENLKIEGSVEPEVRYRGIYKVVTYRAKLHVTGNFTPVDFNSLNINISDITTDK